MNTYISKNIKFLTKKITRKNFKSFFKTSPGTVDNYKNGVTSPTVDFVIDACLHFNITPNELILIDIANSGGLSEVRAKYVEGKEVVLLPPSIGDGKDLIPVLEKRLLELERNLKMCSDFNEHLQKENKQLMVRISELESFNKVVPKSNKIKK